MNNRDRSFHGRTAALHNLGCKVNAYETEAMEQLLEEAGYRIVPFDSPADVYVVNTCSVTNMADRKSRQMLSRARNRNPRAVVVAAGCYVQTAHDKTHLKVDADVIIGNNRKKDLVEILEAFFEKRQAGVHAAFPEASEGDAQTGQSAAGSEAEDCKKEERRREDRGKGSLVGRRGSARENREDDESRQVEVEDISHDTAYEALLISRTSEHTRAFIKVQDGCDQFCSYCIIPYARGRIRSREIPDVIREVAKLTEAGVKEIVLTGIHLSSYGMDRTKRGAAAGEGGREGGEAGSRMPLLGLIRAVADVPGVERIRLGSLEPRIITGEFAQELRKIPQLCPHFHLSLQSGSDSVLRRMNRKYTTAEYEQACRILREVFDQPALTTDVIVGFPGESEEEFAQTKAFLEKLRLYETHIFKFSSREGTRAAAMPGHLPERVKSERSAGLIALGKENCRSFIRGWDGKQAEVLFEEAWEPDDWETHKPDPEVSDAVSETYYTGYTREYIRVYVKSSVCLSNTVVRGTLDCRAPERVLLRL